MMMSARSFAAVFLLASALPARAAGTPAITVSWREKPPYHYTEDGVEKGFLLARARQIFDAAGVPTVWVKEPSKRIFVNLQAGARNYCSIGWYLLPERLQYAQYTLPIHTDQPHIIVASRGEAAVVFAHPTLASLLADKALTLGMPDGVSYGPKLDAMIAAGANKVVRRTVEPLAMLKMVAAGRVSFGVIDREDLQFLAARDPSVMKLARHDFPDMPPGLQRHILCSKDVPPDTMARLNKAITQVLAADKR